MATVTKPMNLDETQQQIVAKLDAIKTAIENGGSGGGSAKIFLGTLDEIEAAIAAGTIETNEAIKCKDDYEDIVGNMAQIAELGDGRICGAINSLNQNITSKQPMLKYVDYTIPTVTISSLAVKSVSSYKPTEYAHPLLYSVVGWDNSTAKGAISITCDGNFVCGTPNETITNLKIRMYYYD